MTTFVWIWLIFAGWFAASCFVVIGLYACTLHMQSRRERAFLDRAAVAQEWEDGELIEEWTRMIDTLSPLAFIPADEVTDD